MSCACHTKGSRGLAAATRAAARPGGSVYCACHTKGSRGPAAATRAAAPPGSSVYCACHTKGSRDMLFFQATAPGSEICTSVHALVQGFWPLCKAPIFGSCSELLSFSFAIALGFILLLPHEGIFAWGLFLHWFQFGHANRFWPCPLGSFCWCRLFWWMAFR